MNCDSGFAQALFKVTNDLTNRLDAGAVGVRLIAERKLDKGRPVDEPPEPVDEDLQDGLSLRSRDDDPNPLNMNEIVLATELNVRGLGPISAAQGANAIGRVRVDRDRVFPIGAEDRTSLISPSVSNIVRVLERVGHAPS